MRVRTLVVCGILMLGLGTGSPALAKKGGGKPGGGGGGGGGSNATLEIVYVKPTNSGKQIKLASADGTNVQTLLSGVEGTVVPCWSSDGTEVAFTGTWDGTSGIHVVDIATGGVRTVLAGAQVYGPAWQPDGDLIAYHTGLGPSSDIRFVDASTGGSWALSIPAGIPDGSEQHPSWSPDGTSLALYQKAGGVQDVVIFTLDESCSKVTGCQHLVDVSGSPLAGLSLELNAPDWSRDGDYVAAYAQAAGEKKDLYAIDVSDPTQVENLTSSRKDSEFRPTWSPSSDGKIAYTSSARSWSIVVLDLATGDTVTIDNGLTDWPDWRR